MVSRVLGTSQDTRTPHQPLREDMAGGELLGQRLASQDDAHSSAYELQG